MRAAAAIVLIVVAAVLVFRVPDGPDRAPPPDDLTESTETMELSMSLLQAPPAQQIVVGSPDLDSFVPGPDRDLYLRLIDPERAAREAADRERDAAAEEFASRFISRACRTDTGQDTSFFAPRATGSGLPSTAVLEPDPAAIEIRHVGDLALPTGRLTVSAGFEAGAEAVRIADPGLYAVYRAMYRTEFGESQLFIQLVLDPEAVPLGWVDTPALSIPSYDTYTMLISAPVTSIDDAVGRRTDAAAARWHYIDQFDRRLDRQPPGDCVWLDAPTLASSAMYFYHFDVVEAAVGLDADGRAVAVTWASTDVSWAAAGLPGRPPESVLGRLPTTDADRVGLR